MKRLLNVNKTGNKVVINYIRAYFFLSLMFFLSLSRLYAQNDTIFIKSLNVKQEIKWSHDYSQTLVMKLFMSQALYDSKLKRKDNGKSEVYCTAEEALDVIKKIDNLTLGIPKIIYLVGWQYNGHDSKYPAWFEGNDRLKRPQDKNMLESIKWLMKEARKFHTTVSLHINMFDAYEDSPLWDEYVVKDIIAKNKDGTLRKGEWGWPISYAQEWKLGYAQKRIDSLCSLLPIKDAGTIHIDAFHTWPPIGKNGPGKRPYIKNPTSPYLNFTVSDETEAQRNIYRYWASKGIDVTSEGTDFLREISFEGFQPMAWGIGWGLKGYIKYPAKIYTGGVDRSAWGKLFGASIHGESRIRNDKDSLAGFLKDFCLNTLPWYYLNRLKREYVINNKKLKSVGFSDGVVTRLEDGDFTLTKKGITLVKNSDVFLPALWLEKPALIAYSEKGYENIEWNLPYEYAGYPVFDVYEITLSGKKYKGAVINKTGKVTLSIIPDEAVVLVPGNGLSDENKRVINAADFGAIPNDDKNDRTALQEAVDECRNNPGSTLIIPPGVYDIVDADAVKLMKDIMNWKMGENSQDIVFTPYYPYTKGLDISGMKYFTIKADGASLMCSGFMEPLSIVNSENVTIVGLTIDYKTVPHSEGKVVKVKNNYMDVELFDPQWISNKMQITRIMFWDLNRNRLLGNSLYHPFKTKKLDDKTVRIYKNTKPKMLGTIALMNHSMHFRPAILILESKNTVLRRVTIHSQPGMGIVGHRSHNVLMEGLRIVPALGKYQSTNTDATHFTSCTGKIRFDGCMFVGMGDDATNVHSYYHRLSKDLGNNSYEIIMEKDWCTHAAVLDFPDAGDKVEIVSRKTLEVMDTMIVIKVDTFPREWRSEIKLNRPLPGNMNEFYVIDVTSLPALDFVNSYVGSHLARGVLVKTRNVLIENCTFRDGTGTAIHIGAEGDWREGPGSANVTIRNNRILGCGRGDATNNGAAGIAINVKAPDVTVPGIHKNIFIYQNIILGEDSSAGISILGTDNVKLIRNEISGCREKINTRHSTNVLIVE